VRGRAPGLKGLRRFVLVTKDAHGLHPKISFETTADRANEMHVHKPDVYHSQPDACEEPMADEPARQSVRSARHGFTRRSVPLVTRGWNRCHSP
jgi:hypothetical protein